jgi:DivIVA domain-containing protein
MEISPQAVSAATFKTVKKGYDPDEVRSYLTRVSTTLEAAQQQATAMEARARAAIAKMQDLQAAAATSGAAAPVAHPRHEVSAAPDESETISRTLLLAQRTADTTVAEAQAEAESVTAAAHGAAETLLNEARAEADRILGEARADARRVKDEELAKADSEVQSLLARRDFLVADVDHLEQYVAAQRERLRDAATALHDLVDRVPGGLGEMRRPLLSASDESGETARSDDAAGDGDADTSGRQDMPFAGTDADNGAAPRAGDGSEGSDVTPPAGDLAFRPDTFRPDNV